MLSSMTVFALHPVVLMGSRLHFICFQNGGREREAYPVGLELFIFKFPYSSDLLALSFGWPLCDFILVGFSSRIKPPPRVMGVAMTPIGHDDTTERLGGCCQRIIRWQRGRRHLNLPQTESCNYKDMLYINSKRINVTDSL